MKKKERQRIFITVGKGKTSFVDTRDHAEAVSIALQDTENHLNKKYVITGDEALDFHRVAEIMTEVLGVNIHYTNPSVKEFSAFMLQKGVCGYWYSLPNKIWLSQWITN